MPDPAARAILECGQALAYGTAPELAAGRFRVGVTWRDGVLRVYAGSSQHRGTFASWHGASVAALVTLAQHEACADV